MITVFGPFNTGAAVGADGSATVNNTTQTLVGELLAVYVRYNGDDPATSDLTIATSAAPVNTLLTLTNTATDAWYQPRHVIHDEAGAVITYDGTREVHEPVPLHDKVKVTLAQANTDDTVDVWFYLRV